VKAKKAHISISQRLEKMALLQRTNLLVDGRTTRSMESAKWSMLELVFTMDTGQTVNVKEKVSWHTQIKMFIQDNGKRERSMVRVLMFSSKQEWSLLESGPTVRLFLENGVTLMELVSKAISITISPRVRASGPSKTVTLLRESTLRQEKLNKSRTTSSLHGKQLQTLLQSHRTDKI